MKIIYINDISAVTEKPNNDQKKTAKALLEAKTENASVIINEKGYPTWLTGTWIDGEWLDGTWQNGLWLYGTWQNGTWLDGTWQNGRWQNGIWQNGVWQNGVWQDGTWENGVWIDGIWQGGQWKQKNIDRILYMLSLLNIVPDKNGIFKAYRTTKMDGRGKWDHNFIQKPGKFVIKKALSNKEKDRTCEPGLHVTGLGKAYNYFGQDPTSLLWEARFSINDIAGFDGEKIRLKSGSCKKIEWPFLKSTIKKSPKKTTKKTTKKTRKS